MHDVFGIGDGPDVMAHLQDEIRSQAMLTLNPVNNRYEGQTIAGTFISVSSKRMADDAHNKAVLHVSNEQLPWDERLLAAKEYLLTHPDVYRTKHNGLSVIVVSKRNSRRK